MGNTQGWWLQSQLHPWIRYLPNGLWASVHSRGLFSLQGLDSHGGHLSPGQEPGQAPSVQVVNQALTLVLPPKPEQVQVPVEVEALEGMVRHQGLGLGVMHAEIRCAEGAGQYMAGPVSLGGDVSGLDLPSVDPWVLHLEFPPL